jgi:hypothetical protein
MMILSFVMCRIQMYLFDELIINILTFCDPYDINIRLVSKKINEMYNDIFIKLIFFEMCCNKCTEFNECFQYVCSKMNSHELYEGFLISSKYRSNDSIQKREMIIKSSNFDLSYNDYNMIDVCIEQLMPMTFEYLCSVNINDKHVIDHYYKKLLDLHDYGFIKSFIERYYDHFKIEYLDSYKKDKCFLTKFSNISKMLDEYNKQN